jgi:hypothetical protein
MTVPFRYRIGRARGGKWYSLPKHGVVALNHEATLSDAAHSAHSASTSPINASTSCSRFHDWNLQTLAILNATRYEQHRLIEVQLPAQELSVNRGILAGKHAIQYTCQAYSSDSLDYVRTVSFHGGDYDVFNFVALPNLQYNLPILGIGKCRLGSYAPYTKHAMYVINIALEYIAALCDGRYSLFTRWPACRHRFSTAERRPPQDELL